MLLGFLNHTVYYLLCDKPKAKGLCDGKDIGNSTESASHILSKHSLKIILWKGCDRLHSPT